MSILKSCSCFQNWIFTLISSASISPTTSHPKKGRMMQRQEGEVIFSFFWDGQGEQKTPQENRLDIQEWRWLKSPVTLGSLNLSFQHIKLREYLVLYHVPAVRQGTGKCWCTGRWISQLLPEHRSNSGMAKHTLIPKWIVETTQQSWLVYTQEFWMIPSSKKVPTGYEVLSPGILQVLAFFMENMPTGKLCSLCHLILL